MKVTQQQPVGSGSSIYFLTKKGSFAGIREYIIAGNQQIQDAANTTIHVTRLIPSGILKWQYQITRYLILLGTENPNKLYVNRWLYGDGFSKALNAWFTYTLNSNRSILNIDFIGTDLILVIEEANGVTLEKYHLKLILENLMQNLNITLTTKQLKLLAVCLLLTTLLLVFHIYSSL